MLTIPDQMIGSEYPRLGEPSSEANANSASSTFDGDRGRLRSIQLSLVFLLVAVNPLVTPDTPSHTATMSAQRVGITALRRGQSGPEHDIIRTGLCQLTLSRKPTVTATPNAFFTQNLAKSVIASSISTSQTRYVDARLSATDLAYHPALHSPPAAFANHAPSTVATERLTPEDAHTILSQQRLKRPVSPHLDIYDKKQTYFGGSIWQRFTGVGFSGLLYGYSIAYLVAPLTGLHLESASLVAAFGALPVAVKGGLKFLVAWPFVFHAMNGVRHAAYDMAWGFKKSTVIRSGWYIWGASIVGALACLML
jgi:succinate dehydrogenase (ubiquinone) cytochrome b560 subunit